jgi:hypothetical protein
MDKLNLNFLNWSVIELISERYANNYINNNGYFDNEKLQTELEKQTNDDKQSIHSLFLKNENLNDVIHYTQFLNNKIESTISTLTFWKNKMRDLYLKESDDLLFRLNGKNVDYHSEKRKMVSYHIWQIICVYLDVCATLSSEIKLIKEEFTVGITSLNQDIETEFFIENQDFIFAFLEVCKTEKIIKRKNSDRSISDEELIFLLLKCFEIKKNNSSDFYKPSSVHQNFVAFRGDPDKYKKYKYLKDNISNLLITSKIM